MYAIWVKVDDSLPWIELRHTYRTRQKAKRAAREFYMKAKVKVVRVSTRTRAGKPGKMAMLQSEVGQVLV